MRIQNYFLHAHAYTHNPLQVWDIEKGELLRVLEGHTSTVRCVHMVGDVIVSGSRDRTVRAWRWSDGAAMFPTYVFMCLLWLFQ